MLTAARDQAHPIAITLDANAEAVMLDFMKPLWTGRNLGRIRRQAEFERFEHAPKIGIRRQFCESAIGLARAGTTPFSSLSTRQKNLPTARAVGARGVPMSERGEETITMISLVAVYAAFCVAALLWMG